MYKASVHRIIFLSLYLLLVSRAGMSMGIDAFTDSLFIQEEPKQSIFALDNSLKDREPFDFPSEREKEGEEEELKEEKREKEFNNYLFPFNFDSLSKETTTDCFYKWNLHSHYIKTVFNDSFLAPFRTQRIFIRCCCFLI